MAGHVPDGQLDDVVGRLSNCSTCRAAKPRSAEAKLGPLTPVV
jgi:hypothetical protein